MKEKKLQFPITSDDYQKFAKKKKPEISDLSASPTTYQNFDYNKENIPKVARVSTKTYDRGGSIIPAFDDDGELTTQQMIEKAKAAVLGEQKKAIKKENEIKNPKKARVDKKPKGSYIAQGSSTEGATGDSQTSDATAEASSSPTTPSDESKTVTTTENKQTREYNTKVASNLNDAVDQGFFSGDNADLAKKEAAIAAAENSIIT